MMIFCVLVRDICIDLFIDCLVHWFHDVLIFGVLSCLLINRYVHRWMLLAIWLVNLHFWILSFCELFFYTCIDYSIYMFIKYLIIHQFPYVLVVRCTFINMVIYYVIDSLIFHCFYCLVSWLIFLFPFPIVLIIDYLFYSCALC